MLSLFVSIGFQVLFHSPPGVLFTFPSRYYTLSVTKSYLALGDGPPIFLPDFSCPAVLRIPLMQFHFYVRDCHSLWFSFPTDSINGSAIVRGPLPQQYYYCWFGLFPFRSPLLRKSIVFFLFLRVLRCFSSPGSPPYTMYSCTDNTALPVLSFLIRTSADRLICSSPQLFAACHVLLRRLVPRHPPLCSC